MTTVAPRRKRVSTTLISVAPRWRARRASTRAVPRSASTALPAWVAVVVWVMLSISFLSGWFVTYAIVVSGLQEHRTNAVLYAQLRERLSGATAPLGGVIARGTPVALLQAPQIGLANAVIVEGSSAADLRNGPGHRRDSPLPGQPGVSQIYGRSMTYGAPFAHISRLQKGEKLTLTTGQGSFSYIVDKVRRVGEPLPTPLPAGGSRLLLETSVGATFGSHETLFVDATLHGTATPAPSPRLSAVPQSETAMAGDTNVLVPLIFWLQALALIAVGVVWLRARWGTWQTWLIGLPLLFAVLWGASNNVLMLLPNLV
jgi:sortase A